MKNQTWAISLILNLLTFNFQDFIIGGDLNADGSYWSNTKALNNPLATDTRFMWTIFENLDTTVTSTDYAYDRYACRHIPEQHPTN